MENKYKIWDYNANGNYVEMDMPERMQNFLEDIKRVCEKHSLSISHEDCQGAFIIEDYDEYDIEWLFEARKMYTDRK